MEYYVPILLKIKNYSDMCVCVCSNLKYWDFGF